ncbi:hypothetical protein MJG53_012842 [Ovis ammon polii x Ovis aries]|uniref:Uncharacterized protein n=2 Tax=Ovis TaxID=9935 RepID=A0A836CTC8_SHEEP|nr:hypothetical protein JEQ12_007910 [Ovis aries]KAI4560261.1 hypothetical protein MJT46_012499 [Ovis ammon polii x Ovis aries]KAI4573004.1 hypothetical protein MJG53_012842 [Ovis ammon polii x Ovis aries]
MIRIFPDFSVQVTAAAAGGAAAGVPAGAGMGRAGAAANGTPQNVQGITSYQQRREGASCEKCSSPFHYSDMTTPVTTFNFS